MDERTRKEIEEEVRVLAKDEAEIMRLELRQFRHGLERLEEQQTRLWLIIGRNLGGSRTAPTVRTEGAKK